MNGNAKDTLNLRPKSVGTGKRRSLESIVRLLGCMNCFEKTLNFMLPLNMAGPKPVIISI